jgi:aryl-alcohol dehydrogenase-like predicted oxidoreductase
MKLILGSANFGKQYGWRNFQVPKQEVWKILETCLENGINTIETAAGYGCEYVLSEFRNQFHYIIKADWGMTLETIANTLEPKSYKPMIHHYDPKEIYDKKYWKGASLYAPQIPEKWMKIVEVPYSILDIFYGQHFGKANTIIRSVFVQGMAMTQPEVFGIPFYHLCWNFALQSEADAIVIGVDSAQQLKDILSIPKYEVDYGNISNYPGANWIKTITQ